MAFKNWDEDGLDIYKRVSRWEVDVWSHYAIDDQTEPANWHMAQTMRVIGNDVWTIEDLYTRSNKRKQEAMETASTDEEPLSEEATINETAMNAMTPSVDAMSSNAL